MLCLQLNRVPLTNDYLRLPRELLDCCAAVAARPNMSKDLVAAMQRKSILAMKTNLFKYFIELNSQHHEVTEQVNDFEQSLTTFEENFDSIKTNKEYKD